MRFFPSSAECGYIILDVVGMGSTAFELTNSAEFAFAGRPDMPTKSKLLISQALSRYCGRSDQYRRIDIRIEPTQSPFRNLPWKKMFRFSSSHPQKVAPKAFDLPRLATKVAGCGFWFFGRKPSKYSVFFVSEGTHDSCDI